MGRAFEYRKAAKMKRWGKMSKIFPRLSKEITLAAKEGGPDPELNAKLRNAITHAKAENMPKDNIDAAIKRASGKEADSLVEVMYEGKGPHGVLVIAECATYFNKAGGGFVPAGSLDFLFSRKAVFEFILPENVDLEELELEMIDAGLESFEVGEGNMVAYADYTMYGSMSAAFEEKGIEVEKASLQRIALNPVEFTDEQLEDIDKMLEKIEDDEDVLEVFTNIA